MSKAGFVQRPGKGSHTVWAHPTLWRRYMKEPLRYSMNIQWSEEDQAYIVTVPELPGCRTHGKTYVEAVKQGEDAIESWIDANKAWGRPIPAPRVAMTA